MLKRILITSMVFGVILLLLVISISTYGETIIKFPETNTKTIGPMDKAIFNIEITNNNSFVTTVSFEIKSVTEDWKAIISDDINIPAKSTSIVQLTVIPPDGFGFHEDTGTIKFNVSKNSYTVFVVSSGFSFFGFELILLIIIFVISIAIFGYFFHRKKTKK